MHSRLIENLRTKEDTELLSEEIELLLQSLYRQADDSFDSALNNSVRVWVSEIIRSELGLGDRKEYLKSLLAELGNIKSISVTLAFEPTQIFIRRFYELLQPSIAKKIVLELVYDPQIVGGAIISYGGRYSDYSFRKIFEDELQTTREQVVQALKKSN